VRDRLTGVRLFCIGGTGFLGKVWLSLVLYHFPEVGHIYLVVRERRRADGSLRQSSEARFWADVASSPVFEPLRKRYPGEAYKAFLRQKVTPVPGDVSEELCGVPASIRDHMRGQLDAFVNASGVVDFNPPLDEALNVNAFGMQNLCALAKDLSTAGRPLPFLHTSTCYVAGDRTGQVDEIDPRSFPFPRADELDRSHWDAEREIAECVDTVQLVRHRANDAFRQSAFLDQAKKNLTEKNEPCRGAALADELEKVKRKFVEGELVKWGTERAKFWGWHNIYTYTKSIGEQVLCGSGLPFTIVRPAVVESSVSYPVVGWNEGINTSAPLIYLALQGPIKYAHEAETVLDVIPVDQVAAGMTLSLAELLEGTHKVVYQYGSSDTSPLRVKRLIELVALYKRQHYTRSGKGNPLVNWVQSRLEPVGVTTQEYYEAGPRKRAETVNQVAGLLKRFSEGPLKTLVDPAVGAMEGVSKLLTVQANISDMFVPFMATHNYRFSCANTRAAYERLSDEEKALLAWTPHEIEWRQYLLEVHCPGLERHVNPEIEAKLKKEQKPLRAYDHLLALLDEVAERHDRAPALLYPMAEGFGRVSYRELRGRAMAVAVRLVEAGVQPGDRVILSGKNHPAWVICWFGIVRAGGVVVPLDAGLSPEAAATILRSCGAKLALVDAKSRASFADKLVVEKRELVEMAAPGAVGRLPEITPKGADLASILYTSGTTGDPKGVMLAHENFTSELGSISRLFTLGAEDRMLSVLPLHHAFEFTCGMLLPLSQGARIYYLDEINADRLSFGLKEGRITCMVGVPALWQLLERRIRSQVKDRGALFELAFDNLLSANTRLGRAIGLDLGPLLFGSIHSRFGGSIRILISGAAALPPDTQKLFVGLGLPLAEGYGLTEAAPVLTVSVPKPGSKSGNVGKPIPGVQIKIGDPDDKGVGEVLARGPNVMKGYYGNDAATAQVLDKDGWLRTGDMGRLDHSGRLILLGRAKEVVVAASGENIYLDDVENTLGSIRYVKEYSLVGLADPRGGERLGLLAVPDPAQGEGDLDKLHDKARAALREAVSELPAFQRPALIHLVDADLPRTASRKVQRKDVRKFLEKIAAATPIKGKAGEGVAAPVARAVAAVAGVEAGLVGLSTRLTEELGFDSLMWVELATALEGLGSGRVDPLVLATAETVADVVRLIGEPAGKALPGDAEEEGEAPIELPDAITGPLKAAFAEVQRSFNGKGLGTKVYGRANIPQNRSAICVSNHSSHLDMGLVKYALGPYGDQMSALAAKDYFFEGNRWKVAWFKNFTNVLPLDRKGGFRASFRQAAEIVEQGKVVLIFPEGTRQTSGGLGDFKPLVGKLSLETGVDILPLYIEGAYAAMPKGAVFPKRRGINIRIGPPLCVRDLKRLTDGMTAAEAARTATAFTRQAVEALSRGEVLDLRTIKSPAEIKASKVLSPEELAEAVFAELPRRFDPSLLERPLTWYFTLGEAKYTVEATAEGATVKPGRPSGSADCVVKTSVHVFARMVREAYVPEPEEFIAGTIKTSDIPLLIEFSRVFRTTEVLS